VESKIELCWVVGPVRSRASDSEMPVEEADGVLVDKVCSLRNSGLKRRCPEARGCCSLKTWNLTLLALVFRSVAAVLGHAVFRSFRLGSGVTRVLSCRRSP